MACCQIQVVDTSCTWLMLDFFAAHAVYALCYATVLSGVLSGKHSSACLLTTSVILSRNTGPVS